LVGETAVCCIMQDNGPTLRPIAFRWGKKKTAYEIASCANAGGTEGIKTTDATAAHHAIERLMLRFSFGLAPGRIALDRRRTATLMSRPQRGIRRCARTSPPGRCRAVQTRRRNRRTRKDRESPGRVGRSLARSC